MRARLRWARFVLAQRAASEGPRWTRAIKRTHRTLAEGGEG
jgi:hypothetical protein